MSVTAVIINALALIGAESGLSGILIATGLGAVMHIPALISFPLAASLLESGAGVGAAAAFIMSLTMLGTVTFPIEVRELGVKMTVFLTAWASVKLPQEMVELRFMGLEFTLLRLVLTVSTAAILGWVVEQAAEAETGSRRVRPTAQVPRRHSRPHSRQSHPR